jgi:Zn-dependent protease with chaperone function
MKQEEFEALVHRMERLAHSAPRRYRWRIYALAAFGYGSLLLAVLLLLGLFALLGFLLIAEHHAVWVLGKLGLIVGALLLTLLRALWVRLEAPTGALLSPAAAPEFFALLRKLRARLDTPPVHRVLVTSDFNAAVTQVPRLGIFGWHRNYLLVGLPLLRSLSVTQLEAVLAHELGHLSRGHARIGNWIYRLRLSWLRLDRTLEAKPQWGSWLIRRFLHWYAPYFVACSYPLARQSEFEADATSAQIASKQAAAQALTNIGVIAGYLSHRYWPGVKARARDMPEPSFGPYSEYVAPTLAAEDLDLQRWLREALAEHTSYNDSHPCLRERLQALNAEAQISLPAPGEAADRLLGASAAGLAREFDSTWRSGVSESWKKAYEGTQQNRARLVQLREQAKSAEPSVDLALERAALEEDVGEGAAVALELRRRLVAEHPQSAPARFVLARQLLQADEAAGVEIMEAVIAEEPEAVLAGSEILRNYWWRRGEQDTARQWHARFQQRQEEIEQGKQERDQVLSSDTWMAHGLDTAALDALVTQLRKVAGLKRAYLVRKQVRYRPEVPLYVFGFGSEKFGLASNARGEAVMAQLRTEIEFPGETLVLSIEGSNAFLGRAFGAIPGAQII